MTKKPHRCCICKIAHPDYLFSKKKEGLQYHCKFCRTQIDVKRSKKPKTFNLNMTQFLYLMTKPCVYCGELTSSRTVDRWDSNKGYEPDNCVSACWRCNKLKGNFTIKDFVNIIRLYKPDFSPRVSHDEQYNLTDKTLLWLAE